MSAASLLKFAYLAYLSKPKGQRALYRAIRTLGVRRIVEFGLTDPVRTARVLAVAKQFAQGQVIHYTLIDAFEERGNDLQPLSLIQAYRQFRQAGVSARLLPGTPARALPSAANDLPATDLLLISANYHPAALQPAWFYIPRMLHDRSLVFRCHDQPESSRVQLIDRTEIEQSIPRRRRLAA